MVRESEEEGRGIEEGVMKACICDGSSTSSSSSSWSRQVEEEAAKGTLLCGIWTRQAEDAPVAVETYVYV